MAHALDDELADSERRSVTVDGVAERVLVIGDGPWSSPMPKMPGITPDVARCARWLRDAALSVHPPSLFGIDDAYPTVEEGTLGARDEIVAYLTDRLLG